MALNQVKRSEIQKLKSYPAFIFYAKGKQQKADVYHPKGSKVPGLEQRDEDINEDHLLSFIQKLLNKSDSKSKKTPKKNLKKEPKKNSKKELKKQNQERAKKHYAVHDEL